MITIAICDDEDIVRIQLQSFCQQFMKEQNIFIHTVLYHTAEELLTDWSEAIDIVLLDIQMEKLNGMDAARRIRELNSTVIIMFITNMLSYAIEGYQVHASHFIPKPISYEQFHGALNQSLQILEKQHHSHLLLHTTTEWIRIPMNQILYVESARNRVRIHTMSAHHETYATMQDMERQLNAECFFRSHSGYLLNLLAVRRINGLTAIMSNGDSVLISKYRKKELIERLTNVLGDQLL